MHVVHGLCLIDPGQVLYNVLIGPFMAPFYPLSSLFFPFIPSFFPFLLFYSLFILSSPFCFIHLIILHHSDILLGFESFFTDFLEQLLSSCFTMLINVDEPLKTITSSRVSKYNNENRA